MTRTEEGIRALHAALAAAAGGALPAATRNLALADTLEALEGGADVHLNVVDGDGEVTAVELGRPNIYEIEHTLALEWIVKAATDEARESAFDAGLEAIHDAIAADETLGGAVDDVAIIAINRSNLAIEGVPQLKGAEISVRLTFTSSRPF
jgi:hypothetical protein